MTRGPALALLLLCGVVTTAGAQTRYPVTGLVVDVRPEMSDVVELRAVLKSGSLVIGQSIGGDTESVVTDPTTPTLASTWAKESGQTRLYIGSAGAGNRSMNPIISVRIARGDQTLATMRTLAKARPHALLAAA